MSKENKVTKCRECVFFTPDIVDYNKEVKYGVCELQDYFSYVEADNLMHCNEWTNNYRIKKNIAINEL